MRRLFFPACLLVIAGLGLLVTTNANGKSNTTSIQVDVAPRSSTITIDGQAAGARKNAVNPGSHQVVVSKNGFATSTRTVSTSLNQQVYVGVVLKPNTPQTQNWYNTHADDELLTNTIGSHTADYQKSVAQQKNPFLQQLPITYGDGYGGIISISSGVPVASSNQPAIYVSASTPALRQAVLTYIRSRGYDPAVMDIVFKDAINPLLTTKEGN